MSVHTSVLRRAIYPFFAPLVDQALQKHDPWKSKAKATNQSDLRPQNHLSICKFLIMDMNIKKIQIMTTIKNLKWCCSTHMSCLKPPLFKIISQTSQETLNHTCGAPKALIRAWKRWKSPQTLPHFFCISLDGCIGLKSYLKPPLSHSFLVTLNHAFWALGAPIRAQEQPKIPLTAAFSLAWF